VERQFPRRQLRCVCATRLEVASPKCHVTSALHLLMVCGAVWGPRGPCTLGMHRWRPCWRPTVMLTICVVFSMCRASWVPFGLPHTMVNLSAFLLPPPPTLCGCALREKGVGAYEKGVGSRGVDRWGGVGRCTNCDSMRINYFARCAHELALRLCSI